MCLELTKRFSEATDYGNAASSYFIIQIVAFI